MAHLGRALLVFVFAPAFLFAQSLPGRPMPDNLPPRVRVEIPSGSAVWQTTTDPEAVLLVANTDFYFTGDVGLESDDSCVGVFALGPYAEVVVSNCSFNGFRQGIVVQGFTGTAGLLRVLDSEVVGTLGQGLYASQVTAIRVRRTHFIDCGEPSGLDHGIYIQSDCGLNNSVVDACAFVNAGSHAAQLRSGGTATNNFVARCPIGLQMGGGDTPKPGGVNGVVSANVIVEGKDIDNPAGNRGIGVLIGNINSCSMVANLLWQNAGTGPVSLWMNGAGLAGQPGVGVGLAAGGNNRVYNWKWGHRIDGVVTTFSTLDWGPAMAMPDTAPTLVLDTLLGPNWVQRLRDRELTAPNCIASVLAVEP